MKGTLLTSKMKRFIRDNYLKISSSQLDVKFSLSKGTSKRYMKENGLIVPKELSWKFRGEKNKGRSIVSEFADFFIICCALHIPVKTMAGMLGYGEGVIQRRVRQLGIVIPKHIIEQRKKDSQIKPGQTPMNKGKKIHEYMSQESIEKTKATRFLKGHLSKNTLYNGAITVRHRKDRPGSKPHKYIRLSKKVWKELQIYNWEKQNGTVPKGYVLACKDGDTLNCDPSNWELLSMADNMKRNSASLNLTDGFVALTIAGRNNTEFIPEIKDNKDLITAKRTTLLIKRKIKLHEKQII